MRRWTLGKYHVRFRFPLLASRALVPCFGGRSHDSCPLGVVVQSVNALYAFCASVALVEALARKQKKKKGFAAVRCARNLIGHGDGCWLVLVASVVGRADARGYRALQRASQVAYGGNAGRWVSDVRGGNDEPANGKRRPR